MIKATGTMKKAPKSRTALIYVPATLVTDFLFPFKKLPCAVQITIDSESLVIEKLQEVEK